MNRTRIKFCGLTRAPDVEAAVALGVDYIGLVLASGSPRAVSIAQAAELARIAREAGPATPAIVLLLRDTGHDEVVRAIEAVAPDLLQFHGSEEPGACTRHGLPYWKAVGMAGGGPWSDDVHPEAAALLLDAHEPGGAGGTGHRFDWTQWPRSARALVLAGGLAPDNVARAIGATRPFAVDVSSGIESAPGIKDSARMAAFVAAVRAADADVSGAGAR